MLTDGALADLDGDGKVELVLVGEWMPITVFTWEKGSWRNSTAQFGLEGTAGFWKRIFLGDLNGDGKIDLLAGNGGQNSRLRTSPERPLRMAINDFDQNGSIEQVYTQEIDGVSIPYTLKHELERQVPSIKKKYIRYADYANQHLGQIFPKEVLEKSIVQEMNHLASGVLLNQGAGNFAWKSFPVYAQKTWIFAIEILDLNGDGIEDLILGGNLSNVKPELGTYDAGYGEVLLGKGDGTFTFWPNRTHGLKLAGDIRAISRIGSKQLLFVKNNAPAEIWTY
jgi:hypothetical protein